VFSVLRAKAHALPPASLRGPPTIAARPSNETAMLEPKNFAYPRAEGA
jgi:hypothetical protein